MFIERKYIAQRQKYEGAKESRNCTALLEYVKVFLKVVKFDYLKGSLLFFFSFVD